MAAPATTGLFADRLYAELHPLAYADEETGWALLHLCSAIGLPFELVEALARDAIDPETGALVPGWSAVVDLDRCPVEWLPWLAQLVGSTLLPREAGETEEAWAAAMRERVRAADGTHRGAASSMHAAARRRLVPLNPQVGAYVIFNERVGGDAYRLAVRTLAAETPDPAGTLRDLMEQKPAGIVLDYQTVAEAVPTWNIVTAAYDSWAEVLAAKPTWNHLVTEMP